MGPYRAHARHTRELSDTDLYQHLDEDENGKRGCAPAVAVSSLEGDAQSRGKQQARHDVAHGRHYAEQRDEAGRALARQHGDPVSVEARERQEAQQPAKREEC